MNTREINGSKILHVQCSIDPVWIITAYDPTLKMHSERIPRSLLRADSISTKECNITGLMAVIEPWLHFGVLEVKKYWDPWK